MSPGFWNGATSGAFGRHRRHRKADTPFPFTSPSGLQAGNRLVASESQPAGPVPLVEEELGPVKAGGGARPAASRASGPSAASN